MSVLFFVDIDMSYYWFNRQELLQKVKEKYHNCGGKEKVAEYYYKNKDVIKEKAKNKYRNKAAKYYAANQEIFRENERNTYRSLSKKKKDEKREYQRGRYHMNNDLNEKFLYSKKVSEQTLKFGDIVVNTKEFHASKQAIPLNLVDANKIVVSDKFKYSVDGSKYFIGYLGDDDIIRPLCITLPQISGYIKYFDDGGKNIF